MRAIVLENGFVDAVSDSASFGNTTVPDDTNPGDTFVGGVLDISARPDAPFKDLTRPAFLFMASKLSLSVAAIEALIAQMPEATPTEVDAKTMALIVFQNQQTFSRSNTLLTALVALSPLTDAQVDAAWRIGEALTW